MSIKFVLKFECCGILYQNLYQKGFIQYLNYVSYTYVQSLVSIRTHKISENGALLTPTVGV